MFNLALLVVVGACVVSPTWQQSSRLGQFFPSSSFNTPSSSSFGGLITRPTFPSIVIPKNCDEAKTSCLKTCKTIDNMNFQCSDTSGVQSSCSCAHASGQGPASSTTARCLAAKAACKAKCPGKVAFRCSDTGNSFSKSCSCVSGDEDKLDAPQDQDMVVATEKETNNHIDDLSMTNIKTFDKEIEDKEDEQPLIVHPVKISSVSQVTDNKVEEQEDEDEDASTFQSLFNFPSLNIDPFSNEVEEQDDEDEEEDTNTFSSFFNFPSIKMDPFSNWNSNVFAGSRAFSSGGGSPFSRSFSSSSGGSFTPFNQGLSSSGNQQMEDDTCATARKQCELQCSGLKMDFDCKNEGGSYAKSCSCAGSSNNRAGFSSSSSSAVFGDEIM